LKCLPQAVMVHIVPGSSHYFGTDVWSGIEVAAKVIHCL
jgi:hypothetical protein